MLKANALAPKHVSKRAIRQRREGHPLPRSAHSRFGIGANRSPGTARRGARSARPLAGLHRANSCLRARSTVPIVIEEPRGSRSAVGEVELPLRHSQAARPLRQRELQRDAGRPHASRCTLEAPSPRRTRCAGATLAHRRARAPAATRLTELSQGHAAVRGTEGREELVHSPPQRGSPQTPKAHRLRTISLEPTDPTWRRPSRIQP